MMPGILDSPEDDEPQFQTLPGSEIPGTVEKTDPPAREPKRPGRKPGAKKAVDAPALEQAFEPSEDESVTDNEGAEVALTKIPSKRRKFAKGN